MAASGRRRGKIIAAPGQVGQTDTGQNGPAVAVSGRDGEPSRPEATRLVPGYDAAAEHAALVSHLRSQRSSGLAQYFCYYLFDILPAYEVEFVDDLGSSLGTFTLEKSDLIFGGGFGKLPAQDQAEGSTAAVTAARRLRVVSLASPVTVPGHQRRWNARIVVGRSGTG